MPLIFYNNGYLVTDYIDIDSIQISKNIEHADVVNFKVSKEGKDTFLFGTELTIFDDAVQIFGGILGAKTKNYTELMEVKDLNVAAEGYKSIPGRIPVQVQFDSSGYCGEIVLTIIASYLDLDGITEGTIQNGGLASEIKPSWQYCSALFDSLASASSFNWWINYDKTLDFQRLYKRIATNYILGTTEDPEKIIIPAWGIKMTEGTREFKTRVAYSGGGIYTQAIDNTLESAMAARYGSGIYGKIIASSTLETEEDALTSATNKLEDASKSANKIQFKTSIPIDIGSVIDVNLEDVSGQYHVQTLSVTSQKQKVIYDITIVELDGDSAEWGDSINSYVANATADSIQDGRKLYGVTIGAEKGLTIQREDGYSDAVFNSDQFTMRSLVDGELTDAIYFNSETRKYKISGQVDIENVVSQDTYDDDIAALQASIILKGGQNIILNSSGRSGNASSWESDGTILAVTGDSDANENTASKSYFKLEGATMSQTFNLVPGTQYTLAFLYKKTVSQAYLKLNDIVVLDSSVEQAVWTKIVFSFVPVTVEHTLEIFSDGSYFLIADIILSEGNNEIWTQAPDEIYNSGMKFDSEGLVITQSESETKFIADSSGTRIVNVNTNLPVATYGKDKMTVKEIACEGQISADKLRIIPIKTEGKKAFMIAINN